MLVYIYDPPELKGGRPSRWAFAAAVLGIVAAYSFAGWAYIAANAVVHPESLAWPLTHLASWPREDTFGIACFVVSFVAALGRAALRSVSRSPGRPPMKETQEVR